MYTVGGGLMYSGGRGPCTMGGGPMYTVGPCKTCHEFGASCFSSFLIFIVSLLSIAKHQIHSLVLKNH